MDRRRARHVRRPRRRPPAARRRRAGHAGRPPGAFGRRRRRAAASCSSPTRSTTPPSRTCGATTTTGSRRSPTSRASTGGRRRRHRRVRTATLDEPGARGTRSTASSCSRTPPRRLALNASIHFLGSRRLATAVLLPTDHDGSPLPVLLDPYGGPHAPRVVRSHNCPTWSRNGSPTRASPSSSPMAVARPDGGSDWERASTAISPRRRSRTRSTPSTGRRRARLPRPRSRRHPRLELRRLSRRARRVAPARRVPRRHRRRAGHRVAAVRHPLHRALPR